MNEFDRTLFKLAILNEMKPPLKVESVSSSKLEFDPKLSTIKDSPDGAACLSGLILGKKRYRCKKYGNLLWMIEDLDINPISLGWISEKNSMKLGSECCYYTWNDAVKIADSIENWRLPRLKDWKHLSMQLGGVQISNISCKLPSNVLSELHLKRTGNMVNSITQGSDYACYWTEDEDDSGEDLAIGICFDIDDYRMLHGSYGKLGGRCVRLVRDL